ncbi:hypothetical protein SSYM_2170, partial [Serratia symbiotica str. Tucson]
MKSVDLRPALITLVTPLLFNFFRAT